MSCNIDMSIVNTHPLAERDMQLREIRKKIYNKKMQLKRNMSMLKQEIGTNEELKQILSDYESSVEELKKKKQEQLIYFELMQDYLDKINKDSNLTAEALIRAKDDQRLILEEMKKVKNELSELAEETSS